MGRQGDLQVSLESDLRFERAHGGIVHRGGDLVTLGDGLQVWLNGAPWARDESDAAIAANPNRGRIASKVVR